MTSTGDVHVYTDEPIIGHRLWRVLGEGLTAWGIGPIVWQPGRNASECVYGDLSPTRGCGCGFWAFKDPGALRDHARRAFAQLPALGCGTVPFAAGRVSLWGRIVEHERGWRAQYACPYDLTVYAATPKQVEAIRRRYRVDVESAPIPQEWLPSAAGVEASWPPPVAGSAVALAWNIVPPPWWRWKGCA